MYIYILLLPVARREPCTLYWKKDFMSTIYIFLSMLLYFLGLLPNKMEVKRVCESIDKWFFYVFLLGYRYIVFCVLCIGLVNVILNLWSRFFFLCLLLYAFFSTHNGTGLPWTWEGNGCLSVFPLFVFSTPAFVFFCILLLTQSQ